MWEYQEIKRNRHFHYEKFPGFIGPKGRRFICIEWLWLLVFNGWAFIWNKPTMRTLWRYRVSDWTYIYSCILGMELAGWSNKKTGEFRTGTYDDPPQE